MGGVTTTAAVQPRRRARPALAAGGVTVAAYVLLASVVTGFGLLLTNVMLDGSLGRWDIDTTDQLAAERTGAGNAISFVASNIAATLAVIGIASVAIVILCLRQRWIEAGFLAVGLVLEVAVFLTVTLLVARERPDVEPLDPTPPTDSYPSGHTAAAVVLYVGLAVVVSRTVRSPAARKLIGVVGVLIPVAVAVSRVYRGMHHPTDVISGLALGALCLAAAVLAMRAAASAGDAGDAG